MSTPDFLLADVRPGGPTTAPFARFVASAWSVFGDLRTEGRLRGPLDLALLFALDWLGGSGHLPEARHRLVRSLLTRVGSVPVRLERGPALALVEFVARDLCPEVVDRVARAGATAGVTPTLRAEIESKLLARYGALPPASSGTTGVPPVGLSVGERDRLEQARARFLAMPDGNPQSSADLGTLLYLAGLFQEGRSTDEREEGAAVRLVRLGLEGLSVRGARLAALGAWLEGEPQPEIAVRVEGLWAQVEADRAAWAARGEAVRRRLAPFWRAGWALDPHQVEGVARIEANRWRMLVSDEMGLGKGPMALGAVTLCPDAWPLLIVAPVSMLGTWRNEVATWLSPTPEVIGLTHPRVLEGLDLRPGQRRVLLANWSFCSLHGAAIQAGALASIRGIIGDESQAMTSPDSARTRSFWRLRTPATLRLLLTGTPMPNGRGIELWSQLAAVESKGLLPLRAWKQRFCGARLQHVAGKGRGSKPKVVQVFDGRSNLVALAGIRHAWELRRTKAELGPDRLPKKTRYVFPITLTVGDHVRIEVEKEAARQALIGRAEKAAADLQAEGGTEAQAQAKMEAMLRASAVACLGRVRALVGHLKIAHVLPLLKDLLEEGHRVVLFGFHLAVLRAAVEQFGRHLCAPEAVLSGVGLSTPEARTDLVRRWEEGEGQILVLSGKYNAGITLISGARMVVLERFWIPATEQQLEDRIHRRGQTEDCAYWYAMAAGTTDDAAGKVITWKETGISASQGSISSRALQVLFAGQVYPGVLGSALGSVMGPPLDSTGDAESEEEVEVGE